MIDALRGQRLLSRAVQVSFTQGVSWVITGDADPRVSAVTVRQPSTGIEASAILERRATNAPGERISLHVGVPITEDVVTFSWTTEAGSGLGRAGSVEVGLH